MKRCPTFKHLASCSILSRSSVILIHDSWATYILLRQLPHLHSLSRDDIICAHDVLILDTLEDHFQLPFSLEALTKFHQLQDLLLNLPNTIRK
jgi:hypothetical protein